VESRDDESDCSSLSVLLRGVRVGSTPGRWADVGPDRGVLERLPGTPRLFLAVSGINPAVDAKPAKVPKRAPAFLEGHEVDRLLADLQEGDLWMVATMAYAPSAGEMYGLRKADVDLGAGRRGHESSSRPRRTTRRSPLVADGLGSRAVVSCGAPGRSRASGPRLRRPLED